MVASSQAVRADSARIQVVAVFCGAARAPGGAAWAVRVPTLVRVTEPRTVGPGTSGMAGTVARHADDPGFRFVLVRATDGAAGDIQPDFSAAPETLGWPPDRHVWFG